MDPNQAAITELRETLSHLTTNLPPFFYFYQIISDTSAPATLERSAFLTLIATADVSFCALGVPGLVAERGHELGVIDVPVIIMILVLHYGIHKTC